MGPFKCVTGNWVSTAITIWKVDDDNIQIPGTTAYFTAGFPTVSKTGNYYLTKKITPAAEYGRYALQFNRLENSNDSSVLNTLDARKKQRSPY